MKKKSINMYILLGAIFVVALVALAFLQVSTVPGAAIIIGECTSQTGEMCLVDYGTSTLASTVTGDVSVTGVSAMLTLTAYDADKTAVCYGEFDAEVGENTLALDCDGTTIRYVQANIPVEDFEKGTAISTMTAKLQTPEGVVGAVGQWYRWVRVKRVSTRGPPIQGKSVSKTAGPPIQGKSVSRTRGPPIQ